jgi:hypothetical protein
MFEHRRCKPSRLWPLLHNSDTSEKKYDHGQINDSEPSHPSRALAILTWCFLCNNQIVQFIIGTVYVCKSLAHNMIVYTK